MKTTDNPACHDVVIAGAGLSGLAAAHFLKKADPGLDLVILERDTRAGGAIQSLREEGFLAEYGPHGFLDNVPESRELISDLKQELGKADELLVRAEKKEDHRCYPWLKA